MAPTREPGMHTEIAMRAGPWTVRTFGRSWRVATMAGFRCGGVSCGIRGCSQKDQCVTCRGAQSGGDFPAFAKGESLAGPPKSVLDNLQAHSRDASDRGDVFKPDVGSAIACGHELAAKIKSGLWR